MRQVQHLFMMEPYALIRTPEYMRFFRNAQPGTMYTLLRSRVYRRGVASLKFYNESGYLTQLALKYDAGMLCAHFTDEELASALAVTTRSIQNTRKTLEELKLIRAEKSSVVGGYFYELGLRPRVQTEDGYDTGEEAESFYIDSWHSKSLYEDSQEHRDFRIWLTEKLAPEKTQAKILEDLRKVFRSPAKIFSEEDLQVGTYGAPVRERKPVAPAAPIEDNTINKLKDAEGEELFPTDKVAEREIAVQRITKEIMKEESPEKLLALGETLRVNLNVNSHDVGSLLTERIPYTRLYALLPRFSLSLMFRGKKEPEHDALTRHYRNLFTDLTGGVENYLKAKSIMMNLLKSYSYEQLLWTLRHVAAKDKNSLNFLSGGSHTFEWVTKNASEDYLKELNYRNEQERTVEQKKYVPEIPKTDKTIEELMAMAERARARIRK